MSEEAKQALWYSTFLIIVSCSIFIRSTTADVFSQSTDHKKLPSICEMKCEKSINSTETKQYCDDHPHLELQHRCCRNISSFSIVGIDLQNCSLTEKDFASGIGNMSDLIIISLQGNPITEMKETDFNHNTGIEYLSLPPKINCPGGDDIWESTNSTSTFTLCLDELDACVVHNISCPQNSHCLPAGVNMTYCYCNEGYHGYKCMNKGEFPYLPFGLGLSIPTVILCLILWMSQRRYVRPKPKYS